jgi:hypothetical protein
LGAGPHGGAGNDTFNITSAAGQYYGAKGMQGNDTFNLTINGTTSIQYNGGWVRAAENGINANLVTGVVSNDGFGGVDQINILGGTGTFELRGTNHTDTIIGSDPDERFRLQDGTDSLNAGGAVLTPCAMTATKYQPSTPIWLPERSPTNGTAASLPTASPTSKKFAARAMAMTLCRQ